MLLLWQCQKVGQCNFTTQDQAYYTLQIVFVFILDLTLVSKLAS